MAFTLTGGALSFTAVYDCVGPIDYDGTITIYDHRTPQPDWAACFALVCSAGAGPGASMWVSLYDSAGNVVATGFSNENGLTFTGSIPLPLISYILQIATCVTVRPTTCSSATGEMVTPLDRLP